MTDHQSIDEAFRVRPPYGTMVAVTLGLVLGLSSAWLIVDFVSGGVVDWGRQMAQTARQTQSFKAREVDEVRF